MFPFFVLRISPFCRAGSAAGAAATVIAGVVKYAGLDKLPSPFVVFLSNDLAGPPASTMYLATYMSGCQFLLLIIIFHEQDAGPDRRLLPLLLLLLLQPPHIDTNEVGHEHLCGKSVMRVLLLVNRENFMQTCLLSSKIDTQGRPRCSISWPGLLSLYVRLW